MTTKWFMLMTLTWIGVILFSSDCFALRNLRIKVPKAVIRGSHATLQCLYDLEGDTLYSVKWYRMGWEFFRFSPSETPPIKQFRINGLHVNEKLSKDTQVVLQNIQKEISGSFSCEVTADQPSFFTDIRTAELMVVDLPKKDPYITGLKTRYNLEDTLKANCTSEGSNPAANLTWYANNVPLDERYIRHHTPTYHPKDQTLSAHSTVKIKVTKNWFNNSKLKLRCSATMFNLYHKSSEKSIELHRKRHRSPNIYVEDDSSLTTLDPHYEQYEIPAERPPQATVEKFEPISRSTLSSGPQIKPYVLKYSVVCIFNFFIWQVR